MDNLKDNFILEKEKVEIIKRAFNSDLPALEGDKVMVIGSTFINYGEDKPYLNHCIILKCSEVNGSVIECYNKLKEVLL